jgi:hypothetical protein
MARKSGSVSLNQLFQTFGMRYQESQVFGPFD